MIDAKEIQLERESRTKAESKAADLERQISVINLDVKNLNQKLERLEQDHTAALTKVVFYIRRILFQCIWTEMGHIYWPGVSRFDRTLRFGILPSNTVSKLERLFN